jgi:phage terminase large subunit GpA-like protein
MIDVNILDKYEINTSAITVDCERCPPTFGGYGIDATYALSDQQEYMIKCSCCNHWQVPVFSKKFINIVGLPDEIELDEIDVNILDKYEINTFARTFLAVGQARVRKVHIIQCYPFGYRRARV